MVKKSSLLIIAYLFACTNLFMSKAYINGIYYLDWISIEIILLFFVSSFRCIPRYFNDDAKDFNMCIIAVIAINMVHIVFTNLKYSQPLSIGLKVSYYYFLLCAFFSFKFYFDSKDKIDFLKRIIVLFVTGCNLFYILRFFITGITGCPHFYLLLLSVPIAMSYILHKTNFLLGLLSIISSVLVRVFLSTNTAFVIIVSSVLVVQVFIYYYHNYLIGRNKVIANTMLFVLIVGIVSFGIVESYVNSVINQDVGTQIRVLAIEYYTEQLVESPVFGLGNLDPNYNSTLYEIVRGGTNKYGGAGQYYFEDIGLIGFICQYGLISLIPIYYMLHGIWKSIKSSDGIEKTQNIGILVMLCGMFISLMPFNKATIQIIPLSFIILYMNAKQSISKGIEM